MPGTKLVIQDERYLLAVLRYVHQNPVVGGLFGAAADYRYSSDAAYRKNRGWLVDVDLILDILASERSRAIGKYVEFMNIEDDADYDEPDVIGDDSFALGFDVPTTPQRKRLDDILLETGLSVDDYNLIKAGSRRRHLSPYKRLYVKAALDQKSRLRKLGLT